MSPSVPADRTAIGGILDAVSQQMWEKHQIILSVIVHRKTAGRTRPGPGFFELAKRLGLYRKGDDEDELIERESEKGLELLRPAISPSDPRDAHPRVSHEMLINAA